MKIAVLFGGKSSEHEVSRASAKSVIENIPKEKYELVLIGITKQGHWLHYRGPLEGLSDGSWESDPMNRPASILPDSEVHGILETDADGHAERIRIDAAFPVLHGANGEDGTVQGLLTLAGIPFVGCGTAASAVCMDKALVKSLLADSGIGQAKWVAFDRRDFEKEPETYCARVEKTLGYPVFVKPANAGSSVGISKAADRERFFEAVRLAARHDKKIIVEEAVRGREVECAVLGNQEPEASVCGEIVPCNEFYDYEAKYISGTSKLFIPARISREKSDEVRRAAVRAYKILGCEGMARMDFFIREDGAVLLSEPNTIPGFTSISMYPKLFEASGLSYAGLLDRLITLALER